MSAINQDALIESIPDIWIVGLNRDKTRKTNDSDTVYQVYFELSGTPPLEWRNIFEDEWKALNPIQPRLWQEASIDRAFLVMHCPLREIAATHFPVLKKAVTQTNETYRQYAQEQATEHEHRVDVWKHERKAVDEMAESLHFG
ncbi:MAG: hypothetical protein WBW16_03855 [Bacteroidota bacterium]